MESVSRVRFMARLRGNSSTQWSWQVRGQWRGPVVRSRTAAAPLRPPPLPTPPRNFSFIWRGSVLP